MLPTSASSGSESPQSGTCSPTPPTHTHMSSVCLRVRMRARVCTCVRRIQCGRESIPWCGPPPLHLPVRLGGPSRANKGLRSLRLRLSQVQLHVQQGGTWAVGTHRCVVNLKSGRMVVLMPSAQVQVLASSTSKLEMNESSTGPAEGSSSQLVSD